MKQVRINNIKIKYSKDYEKYQCWAGKVCLEEFKEQQEAVNFCKNTFDYCKRIYEVTFWDYYGFEFEDISRKFNNKSEAIDYLNTVLEDFTPFKTIIYFNENEILFNNF